MLTKRDVIEQLDHRSQKLLSEGCFKLQSEHTIDEWMPAFIEALPEMKNAMSRKYVLFHATRNHIDFPEILPAARAALTDRSWLVREDALGVLAYACDKESLRHIEPLLSHRDDRTKGAALRATKAIEKGNRHLFLSLNGNVTWL